MERQQATEYFLQRFQEEGELLPERSEDADMQQAPEEQPWQTVPSAGSRRPQQGPQQSLRRPPPTSGAAVAQPQLYSTVAAAAPAPAGSQGHSLGPHWFPVEWCLVEVASSSEARGWDLRTQDLQEYYTAKRTSLAPLMAEAQARPTTLLHTMRSGMHGTCQNLSTAFQRTCVQHGHTHLLLRSATCRQGASA